MKSISKLKLAKYGEDLAAEYLITAGYQVLCRNFRIKQGEIDIIVEKDQQLIFVEVKTRSYHSIQSALDTINFTKQMHISRVAQVYCKQNPQFGKHNTRFDVIAVIFDQNSESFNIHHYPDAFVPITE